MVSPTFPALSPVWIGVLGVACLLGAAGFSSRGASGVETIVTTDTPNPFIEVAAAGSAGQSWGSAIPAHLVFRPRGVAAVAASVDAAHGALVVADELPRRSEPVLRLSRLSADLEFRGRAAAEDGNLAETCELVQSELEMVETDIAERYFAGAATAAGTVIT